MKKGIKDADNTDLSWLELEKQDYSDVEDCENWKFNYYAVKSKSGMYVMGFDDEYECREYCKTNGYHFRRLDSALASYRKPYKLKNWTDSFSSKGLK